jgi:two-component system, chemotaxis family, protein-glutamate methylesterase/glutaminase
MAGHDIIVVGASAGGVEALVDLVRDLPPDLPAAVCVVLHVPAAGTSVLPQILSRAGPLRATHARDGEPLRHRRIYVAPPDQHLMLEPGRVRLFGGPRENGHRPAVDVLFRSAALTFGPRVVGVVLSGTLDDGTAGLLAIKRCGGVAVVQQPADARYSGMPESALQHVVVDHCVPVREIPAVLTRLAHEPAGPPGNPSVEDRLQIELRSLDMDPALLNSDERPGEPAVYACPECHGTLWEVHDGDLMRYRCRVGHAYTAESLLAEQSHGLEAALWAALRALEEKASLASRLRQRAAEQGHMLVAERFEEQEQDARLRAEMVRQTLLNSGEGITPDRPHAEAVPTSSDAPVSTA